MQKSKDFYHGKKIRTHDKSQKTKVEEFNEMDVGFSPTY